MSRSRKKNPIFSPTSCHSEKVDKRIWHKRLRMRDRIANIKAIMDSIEDLDNLYVNNINEVSNVWTMGKDGKTYWSKEQQERYIEYLSDKGKTSKECSSLKKRHKHKLMGK